MSGIIDNFLIIGVQAGILVIVIAIFRFLLRKRSKLSNGELVFETQE